MKIEIPNSLLVTLSGVTSRGITAAEVRELDGHLLFTLTDGSRIDLGSVMGPAGAKGETGATGPAGADGYSPTASVQRTETGAIVTITDKTGTSYASVSDGKDGSPGAKGEPGDDYVLTDADKQEIAASVVAGGLEVEVSDETPGGGADILLCHISGSGTDASPYACDKTSQEIAEAAAAGKLVYAVDDAKRVFPLVSGKPVSASFTMTLTNGNLIGYQVKSSTVTYITRSLQDAADRVTALSEESTDAQYPSAKCVYEALQGSTDPRVTIFHVTGSPSMTMDITLDELNAAIAAGNIVFAIRATSQEANPELVYRYQEMRTYTYSNGSTSTKHVFVCVTKPETESAVLKNTPTLEVLWVNTNTGFIQRSSVYAAKELTVAVRNTNGQLKTTVPVGNLSSVATSGLFNSFPHIFISGNNTTPYEIYQITSAQSSGTYPDTVSTVKCTRYDSGKLYELTFTGPLTSNDANDTVVTKTETALLPVSSDGTSFVLNSSTADSTKRFRITVDDSGTLTATEVTDAPT